MKAHIGILGALLILFMIAAAPTAKAAPPMTFFGEDLGLGENTPLPATPNADAAQAAFLANLIGVGTEMLEAYAAGTGAPLAVMFPAPTPVTATLQGNGEIVSVPAGQTNGFGRYPISGTKFWESSDVFSIDFDQPIAAFGFYGVDVGDFNGQLTLTLTDGSVLNLVIPHTVGSPGGTVVYFGVIDTENQYTSISFGNTAPGVDFFAFDDFTIGTIEQVGFFALDIKPTSCPNPLNVKPFMNDPQGGMVKKGGVLPVAVLGNENIDVTEIDVSTVLLEGVAPVRYSYEDVSTPIEDPEECECNTEGADGYMDLALKFSKAEIVATLGVVTDGQLIELTLTGELLDGTPFEASDCVLIRSRDPIPVMIDEDEVVLGPAVPNPFNPTTRISYILPESGFVKLSIYDVTGKLVESLVQEVQPVGEHVVEWDAGQVTSGVYFYRLEVGDFADSRKMILLR